MRCTQISPNNALGQKTGFYSTLKRLLAKLIIAYLRFSTKSQSEFVKREVLWLNGWVVRRLSTGARASGLVTACTWNISEIPSAHPAGDGYLTLSANPAVDGYLTLSAHPAGDGYLTLSAHPAGDGYLTLSAHPAGDGYLTLLRSGEGQGDMRKGDSTSPQWHHRWCISWLSYSHLPHKAIGYGTTCFRIRKLVMFNSDIAYSKKKHFEYKIKW